MLVLRPLWLLAGAALIMSAPALAQGGAASAAAAPEAKPVNSDKRVYALADFARFAPKTAYDMLNQVPGFTIQTTDKSNRGLGQASENVLINGQRVANKSGGAVDQLQRTPASSESRSSMLQVSGLRGFRARSPMWSSKPPRRPLASSNMTQTLEPISPSRSFLEAPSAFPARKGQSTTL